MNFMEKKALVLWISGSKKRSFSAQKKFKFFFILVERSFFSAYVACMTFQGPR